MQFLFSRPYFHVFFKPVITVLSKKSQSDGCSWGKRYSRVLESLLWVLTAGLQSAAHGLRSHCISATLGLVQPSRVLADRPAFCPRRQKLKREVEFSFSAPHIRRKTRGVLQFSVCFRERQGKSFMFAFLFSFYSHWLNHSNFFSFLSYLILSLFISPRSSFTSRLNAVLCQIEVETNFTCVFLTIADASIWQVFESHVSSLARSYDRKKKLRLKKHGPRIKLTYCELVLTVLARSSFWKGDGEFLLTVLFVSVRCRWIKIRQCNPTDLCWVIWRSREEFCWVQAEWREV